jgi:DNA polymerase-3 subunit beta
MTSPSTFALATLPREDFPVMASSEYHTSFTAKAGDLRRLFEKSKFAISTEETRYYLNGVYLHVADSPDGRVLRCVATDGHRLAHCQCAVDTNNEATEVIVPRKTVLEMQRLLSDADEPVTIEVGTGQIRFRFGEVELISKLVEGKFPDYKRVIPTNYTRHFDVSREALLGSLQRAAILTTDKLRSVRFQIGANTLIASSTNAEQEEALEEIDIDYSAEALDVGFNVSYLLDFLSSLKEETVRWSVMPDANASALLTLPDDDSFQYVVMPMRI